MLRYKTQNDGRVRDEHIELEGITLPVSDPFWNTWTPTNGYRCRCFLEQLPEGVKPSSKERVTEAVNKQKIAGEFKNNAGKSGKVFTEKHPHFKVAKGDEELKANNFGLTVPELKGKKAEFIPAKSMQELETRAKALGIKSIDLNGIKIGDANYILKALEDNTTKGLINLDAVGTYRNPKSRALAVYSPSQNKISYNLSKQRSINKFKTQELESFSTQVNTYKNVIKEWEDKYLGNPKYNQTKVINGINKYKRKVSQLERAIEKGEEAKYWSVAESVKDKNEYLYAITTHELGHYKHYKLIGENTPFAWSKAQSVTEYGQLNKFEYLAEWYTQYKINGPEGVPAPMLKLFKELD